MDLSLRTPMRFKNIRPYSRAYENKARVKALDKQTPLNHVIKKDTFVIPAGGAIVTRMRTGNRGLWMVNGQKDVHSEDGMVSRLKSR